VILDAAPDSALDCFSSTSRCPSHWDSTKRHSMCRIHALVEWHAVGNWSRPTSCKTTTSAIFAFCSATTICAVPQTAAKAGWPPGSRRLRVKGVFVRRCWLLQQHPGYVRNSDLSKGTLCQRWAARQTDSTDRPARDRHMRSIAPAQDMVEGLHRHSCYVCIASGVPPTCSCSCSHSHSLSVRLSVCPSVTCHS
jgi:hypothetical protein